MLVEKIAQDGSIVEYRVVATDAEYREAARNGVRSFLLQAGAPVPSEDQLDTILSQIIGPGTDVTTAKRDFAANYLVPRAIQQVGVVPVCSPRVSIESKVQANADSDAGPRASSGADFILRMRVCPQPVVELTSYEPVDLELNVPDVTEDYKLSLAAACMSERLAQEVPADVIDAMADSMMAELRDQAAGQGVSVDDMLAEHDMTKTDMEQRAHEEAEGMLRQGLALDAVFRHERLVVEDQDRAAALHAIAPGAEDEAAEHLEESGYAFTIEQTAQRIRAGRYILEHAKVVFHS